MARRSDAACIVNAERLVRDAIEINEQDDLQVLGHLLDNWAIRARDFLSETDGVEMLGGKLRDMRISRGLSKRAIANLLGVTIPTIMRWENGDATPSDYNVRKINSLLRIGDVQ